MGVDASVVHKLATSSFFPNKSCNSVLKTHLLLVYIKIGHYGRLIIFTLFLVAFQDDEFNFFNTLIFVGHFNQNPYLRTTSVSFL